MEVQSFVKKMDSRFKQNQDYLKSVMTNIKVLSSFNTAPHNINFDSLYIVLEYMISTKLNPNHITIQIANKELYKNKLLALTNELNYEEFQQEDQYKIEKFISNMLSENLKVNIQEKLNLNNSYIKTMKIVADLENQYTPDEENAIFNYLLANLNVELLKEELSENSLIMENDLFSFLFTQHKNNFALQLSSNDIKEELQQKCIEMIDDFVESSDSNSSIIFKLIKEKVIFLLKVVSKTMFLQDFTSYINTEKTNQKDVMKEIQSLVESLDSNRSRMIEDIKKNKLQFFSLFDPNSKIIFDLFKIQQNPIAFLEKCDPSNMMSYIKKETESIMIEILPNAKTFCELRNNYAKVLEQQWALESGNKESYMHSKSIIDNALTDIEKENNEKSLLISVFLSSLNKLNSEIQTTVLGDLSITFFNIRSLLKTDIENFKTAFFVNLIQSNKESLNNQRLAKLEKTSKLLLQQYEINDHLVDFIFNKINFGDNGIIYFVDNSPFEALDKQISNIIKMDIAVFNNELNSSSEYSSFREKMSETITESYVTETIKASKLIFKAIGIGGELLHNAYPIIGTIMSSLSLGGDLTCDGIADVVEKKKETNKKVEEAMKVWIKRIASSYIKTSYIVDME